MHRGHEMSRTEDDEFLADWYHENAKRRRHTIECSPNQFRSKLEDFFRPYISSARSDGNFDRVCFRIASMEFVQHLRHPELASVYHSYVVQECYEFISADKKMMFTTLKQYITKRLEIHNFKLDTGNKFRYESPDSQRYARVHVPEMFSDDEDDYYTQMKRRQRTIHVPKYETDITLDTLEPLLYKPFLYQDFECVKNLLLYIMPVNFVTDDLCNYSRDVILCLKLKDPSLSNAAFLDNIGDNFPLCYKSDSCPARRMKLLLMSIDFVAKKRRNKKFGQDCIDSLKLFFDSIPDACITSDEVRSFLVSIVKDLDRDGELLIDDFCRSFEEEFPKSSLPVQPRPLKHLCRCHIRRKLSSDQELPVGVKRLGIPIPLQKYISFLSNVEVPHQNTMDCSLKAHGS